MSKTRDDDVYFEPTDAEGAQDLAKDKLKKIRTELDEVRKERDEYLTLLQRSRADYANLQKEESTRHSLSRIREQASVFRSLISVADSFDAAMKNKQAWESVDSNWRVGVEYIYSQLRKVFDEYGVQVVAAEGMAFDTAIHEPIDYRETNNAEEIDTIVEIVQQGYRLGEILLRPAKVILARYDENNSD